jgi:hypothetical protein
VLDEMLLIKKENGKCRHLDLEDLPAKEAFAINYIKTGTKGLFDSADADTLIEGMVSGSDVLALAIEHV